ncbi:MULTISPECIES: hypothetical protein [unclassified Vibrio]|uniref:Uncharacterized protein n=1 Tax=Vibrio sp. HB236076 TaxID=3232307 RepID=A0AB39HFR2_9VIBR|nr:hypothetical protein [Vibrio sp. HB161653]MDP5254337.1 hypothetical protein [Vibrio sp. HB161653]
MIKKAYCFEPLIGEDSTSQNNLTLHSSSQVLKEYDWLIFTDSRGLERDDKTKIENTWIYKTCEYLKKNKHSFLVISRPKNLTTFSTLINFLELNEISFKGLITNVGFVDCTPKKRTAVNDIKLQLNNLQISEQEEKVFSSYELNNGNKEQLYSISLDKKAITHIQKVLKKHFSTQLLIKTPIIPKDKEFQRKRPNEFYEQIEETNSLIDNIANGIGAITVDFPRHILETFDGVHFTDKDHDLVYALLKKMIIEQLKNKKKYL